MRILRWLIFGFSWGVLNAFDKNKVKKIAYNKGYNLSQRFKKYKTWDNIVEPIIIKQFAFLFGVSNAFIKGLISDNKPDKNLEKSLENFQESVDKDLSEILKEDINKVSHKQ